MHPKLRICDLKIWASELIRNSKQWLKLICTWSPLLTVNRGWDRWRGLTEKMTKPSLFTVFSVFICSTHIHYVSMWQMLTLTLGIQSWTRMESFPNLFPFPLPLHFYSLSLCSQPLCGSHMVWWKRQSGGPLMVLTGRVTGQGHKLLLGNCHLSGKKTAHLSIQRYILNAHHTCGTL